MRHPAIRLRIFLCADSVRARCLPAVPWRPRSEATAPPSLRRIRSRPQPATRSSSAAATRSTPRSRSQPRWRWWSRIRRGSAAAGSGCSTARATDSRSWWTPARRRRSKAAREIFLDDHGRPMRRGDHRQAAKPPGFRVCRPRWRTSRSATAGCRSRERSRPAIRSRARVSPWIRASRASRRCASACCRTIRRRRASFSTSGRAPAAGYVLRQPELAATLERLARCGRRRFLRRDAWRARWSRRSIAPAACGSSSDLAEYRVVERAPVRFQYRGATITAAALPSAGGIALAQALEHARAASLPADARASRRGSSGDRGDAARVSGPRALSRRSGFRRRAGRDGCVSKDYAQRRAASIDAARATPQRRAGRGARPRARESATPRICRSSMPKATASPRR